MFYLVSKVGSDSVPIAYGFHGSKEKFQIRQVGRALVFFFLVLDENSYGSIEAKSGPRVHL
jgi:hypothetical protein